MNADKSRRAIDGLNGIVDVWEEQGLLPHEIVTLLTGALAEIAAVQAEPWEALVLIIRNLGEYFDIAMEERKRA